MTPSEDEMIAILLLKRMLRGQSPQTSVFLDWVATRLVKVHGESDNVDFVRAIRRYSEEIRQIERTLKL